MKQYLNEAKRIKRNTESNTISCSASQTSNKKSKLKHQESINEDDDDEDSSSVTISSLGSSASSLFNNEEMKNTILRAPSFKNKTNDAHKRTKSTNESNDYNENMHLLDSDGFNFWVECASVNFGPIMLDMTLDKGN